MVVPCYLILFPSPSESFLESESKPGRRKKSGLPSSSSKLPSFLTAKRPGFKDPSRPTIHGLTSKPVSTSQAPDESLFPPHGPPTRDSVARSDVDSSLNDPTGGGTTAREQPPRFGGNGTEDNPIALDDQDTPDTYSGSIQSSSKRMKMENGNSVNISTLQTSSSVHMGHDQSHSSDSASKKRKRMSSGDPVSPHPGLFFKFKLKKHGSVSCSFMNSHLS